MGLNEIQTLLRTAVEEQDYGQAGRLSDELFSRLYDRHDNPTATTTTTEEERRSQRRQLSWKGLGSAPWLVDRLDSLNYTFPTTIQINSMRAVNAILNTTQEILENTSFEERVDMNGRDMGIVISGTTGSGKTLAYLVPLLSTLSDSLFTRQRIRVGAEENVGDITGDLLNRVALVTSPVVRTNSRRPVRDSKTIATGASLATLGQSGKDVTTPLALIVVPSRELGVQIALLLYQLVGGNIKKSNTAMSGKANMFKYKGPKGIKIGCVLDDEESEFGLKLQTDVAITTPKYLGKLLADGDVKPSMLRVIVYDEADLGLDETDDSVLSLLFDDDPESREYVRMSFLVGATLSLRDVAVRSRILPEDKSYIATALRFAPLKPTDALVEGEDLESSIPKSGSLQDCLHSGLRHERVKIGNSSGLLVLTRLLRKELRDYEEAAVKGDPAMSSQRPRVVVFFPDEPTAKAAIEPLRDAMWGEHKLCVLLPTIGVSPLDIMDKFKNNETSVMLATPNSVRGLDFPALTHVYTLYLPTDDPREYVHLAGRVGRVGQLGSVRGTGGRVVSILKEEEAEGMEQLAEQLGFEFVDVEPIEEDSLAPSADMDDRLDDQKLESVRRYLEDAITLLDLVEDAEDGVRSVNADFESGAIDVDAKVDEDDNDEKHFQ